MYISTDMLVEQVLEERDPDLNEDEDIIMNEIRYKHWRVVPAPDGILISILTC